MKRITSFTLMALLSSTSYLAACDSANCDSASCDPAKCGSSSEQSCDHGTSWKRLQETLSSLNATRGADAPSLDLTLVVNQVLHKADLKPSELLEVTHVIDAANAGDWATVRENASSETVRHLLPAAAAIADAHAIASSSPAVASSEWDGDLTSNPAYSTLSELVRATVESESTNNTPYLPSVLLTSDGSANAMMRAVEDRLFEEWDANESVREELMSADTVAQLLKSLGRYPRGNREIFDHFLAAVSANEAEALWTTFDSINSELAQAQAAEARSEIVRASHLALEKARQNSARPQDLFVEVFSDQNSNRSRVKVNEPIAIRYSYNIGSNVPHTMWITVRDKDDTVIYEKTLQDLAFDESHQTATVTLPGVNFSGNFKAQLTIRNEQGHFSDSSDSFRVVENLSVADQERHDTLEALFGAATEEANGLVARLQELAAEYDALHPELVSGAETVASESSELEADNLVNTPEENIEKWLESGRYSAYETELAAYNEDVETSDELLEEGVALKERLAQVEELTRPLAEALDAENLEEGLTAATSSVVTEELGFAEKVAELTGRAYSTEEEVAAEATSEETLEAIESVEVTEEVTEMTEEASEGEELGNVESEIEEMVVSDYQESFNMAVLNNNIEGATEALLNGANINYIDESNLPILHQVVQSENLMLDTVEFLVNNGADVHATNGNGTTAMMALALSTNPSSERESVLRYFIERGVHFNAHALKRVKNKAERVAQLREEQNTLNSDSNHPYLYDEAISLMEEASSHEEVR